MIVCTTTSRSTVRPRLYRGLACFFVVLYVLASIRGLVPGLCLNLRAGESYQALLAESDCEIAESGSCCATVVQDERGGRDSQPAAPKPCPFCQLAYGLTETPEYFHFEPLASPRFHPAFAPVAHGVTRYIDTARSERGPPGRPAP